LRGEEALIDNSRTSVQPPMSGFFIPRQSLRFAPRRRGC